MIRALIPIYTYIDMIFGLLYRWIRSKVLRAEVSTFEEMIKLTRADEVDEFPRRSRITLLRRPEEVDEDDEPHSRPRTQRPRIAPKQS